MKVILLSHAAVAMKPGSNVNASRSRVMFAILRQSGPSVPLLASRTDFLPVATLTSSYLLAAIAFPARNPHAAPAAGLRRFARPAPRNQALRPHRPQAPPEPAGALTGRQP